MGKVAGKLKSIVEKLFGLPPPKFENELEKQAYYDAVFGGDFSLAVALKLAKEKGIKADKGVLK